MAIPLGEFVSFALSHLPAPGLASATKSDSADPHLPRNETSSNSKIIDHFVSERSVYLAAARNGSAFSQDRRCAFVEQAERLYGPSVAALLHEPPFLLSLWLVHSPPVADGLQWFDEFIDELVHRLPNRWITLFYLDSPKWQMVTGISMSIDVVT